MPIDDVYRLVVNQALPGSLAQNVLYYKIKSEDVSLTDIASLSSAFLNQVMPSWVAAVSDEVDFACMELQKVFPLPIAAKQEFLISQQGTVVGESLPAMSSMLFQKVNNATGGVGKKGRVYVIGCVEDNTNDGRINVAQAALNDALATAFQQDVTNLTSFSSNPVWAIRQPNGTVDSTVDIDVVTALPRIATQRRRRTGIRSTVP